MFSNELKIMLYVNDVPASSQFWQAIGFVERERAAVDGTVVVELSPTAESQTRIVLYDLGFIQQHSPEVAGNSPSLMFASDTIFDLYKKMQAAHVTLGDLVQLGEEYVFNFADNEGNYFAVSGK
ncbi:VOC family protein [Enterococcus sp. LJL120]